MKSGLTNRDGVIRSSIGRAGIRNEFLLEEYFLASAFEPDHIAIFTIKFVSLDNDSFFPNRIGKWKLLADCLANGELCSLSGHAITKGPQIERT